MNLCARHVTLPETSRGVIMDVENYLTNLVRFMRPAEARAASV